MSSLLQSIKRDAGAVAKILRVVSVVKRVAPEKSVLYNDFLEPYFSSRRDRPALIGGSGSMTWGALDEYANRVAQWALSEGLGRGDVVGFSMENRPEYVAIWLGLSRVGVISALFNTNLSGDSLAHCVREAAPRHWIVGEELLEAAETALPELEKPPKCFVSGPSGSTGRGAGEHEDFDALLLAASPAPVPKEVREPLRSGDGLCLIYTSGTTGMPKAARISHGKAITVGMGGKIAQDLTTSDRVYCCLPLYHSAGGLMAVGAALFAGGALVIAKRFSATRFWSDCTQNDVTSIQYIGELCRYLLNSPEHPDERRHSIRTALGNGLRPEVWPAFQKRFAIPKIVEFYGATEGNTALVNFDGKVGAVGQMPAFLRKIAGIEILRFDIESEEVLRNEDGTCQRAAVGEAGEFAVKISKTTRFEGYTNPEATEKKILRDVFKKGDAYFRSGDLLRLDEEGYFYFVDRIGDTFRWKGENVATSEVSEVLSVEQGVHEANVYGVAIEGMDGRAGMAALVTDASFDLGSLGRRIVADLAFYARPVFIRLLPEMEITGTFKHRKVDLVREGFDPETVPDPVFYLNPDFDPESDPDATPTQACYLPLDSAAVERIRSGQIRL
jgi:fatty-acyl-CoA synthase